MAVSRQASGTGGMGGPRRAQRQHLPVAAPPPGGIAASVVTSPPGPCRGYPASSALLHQVFPGSYRPGPPPPPTVIVIRPSALPSGTGVQLAGSFQRSPREVAVAAPILVYASPQCTGS
jgi:hypothetical protein